MRRLVAWLALALCLVAPSAARAGVYTTTVNWGGGFCLVCGGDYACSNGTGNWNGGNATFVDPSGGINGLIVSVSVTVHMINCQGGVNTATLDGAFVGN